jgi:hypothetical protein
VSVVTISELAAYLGVDTTRPRLQETLEAAEGLAAGYLGAEQLAERQVTVMHTASRSKYTVPLSDGPLVELTSVTRDGATVDTQKVQVTYWMIALEDGVGEGEKIVVTFNAGWTATNLPDRVRQAVLMTAASIFDRPNPNVRTEQVGGVTVSYATTNTAIGVTGISDEAKSMLHAYRRPGL